MADRERNETTREDGEERTRGARIRPAGFFRALVVAAVAAAAPVAGCYESDPAGDAAADADASADDGTSDDAMLPAYGVPDGWDDSVARYAVPMYGAP